MDRAGCRHEDLFASRDLIALQSWAREYHAQVAPFIAGLKHEDLSRTVHLPWAERFGQTAEDPMLGETMIQVAMHSQYHRGQINTRLRELGAEPPLVDYIAWIWFGRPDAAWSG